MIPFEELVWGMLTKVVFMGKKLSLVLMGKSQFCGIRSLLETKSFWSSLLKNRTQEAKKMCLLEVEKI